MKRIYPVLMAMIIPLVANAQNTFKNEDGVICLVLIPIFIAMLIFRIMYQKEQYSKEEKRMIEKSLEFGGSDSRIGQYLIFESKTAGLPKNRNAGIDDFDNWPYPVQVAWILFDEDRKVIKSANYILKQNILILPAYSFIHGITTDLMEEEGVDPKPVYEELKRDILNSKFVIAHNLEFNIRILECDNKRRGSKDLLFNMESKICIMKASVDFCKLPGQNGEYKYPNLEELFGMLFYNNPNEKITVIHDASIDILLSSRCFFGLIDQGVIKM